MGLKKKIRTAARKVRSNSGESFAEILAASAIISLAMVMLLSMVMASARMVSRAQERYDLYYDCRTGYEKRSPQVYQEDGVTTTVSADTEGTVTISGQDLDETLDCVTVTSTSEDESGNTCSITGYIVNADD